MEHVFDSYSNYRNDNLMGRYIHTEHIFAELEKLASHFQIQKLGDSVLGNPIYSVQFGTGTIKILGWSQMHGNESTTTKGLFDLFNFFSSSQEYAIKILERCSFSFIPILNPDGAKAFTRENANSVDLNRDALRRGEPESQVLYKHFKAFQPNFCLNLHDQRNIFSAGPFAFPATLSFLAPAMDENCTVNPQRETAMQLIAAMADDLKKDLPQRIGRFDDSFNPNCTGDAFQLAGVPTMLFEAGYYQGDPDQEETRKFLWMALVSVISHISQQDCSAYTRKAYFNLPENQKKYCDILLKNAEIHGEINDVEINFEAKLESGKLKWEPKLGRIQKNLSLFGHKEIDFESNSINGIIAKGIFENDIVGYVVLKNINSAIKRE